MGARSMSVRMQAAEPGLSSDSRGARTDPALPEPLARFHGPLLVSAASGTQIESPAGDKAALTREPRLVPAFIRRTSVGGS
jgi:hypothetical protein